MADSSNAEATAKIPFLDPIFDAINRAFTGGREAESIQRTREMLPGLNERTRGQSGHHFLNNLVFAQALNNLGVAPSNIEGIVAGMGLGVEGLEDVLVPGRKSITSPVLAQDLVTDLLANQLGAQVGLGSRSPGSAQAQLNLLQQELDRDPNLIPNIANTEGWIPALLQAIGVAGTPGLIGSIPTPPVAPNAPSFPTDPSTAALEAIVRGNAPVPQGAPFQPVDPLQGLLQSLFR